MLLVSTDAACSAVSFPPLCSVAAASGSSALRSVMAASTRGLLFFAVALIKCLFISVRISSLFLKVATKNIPTDRWLPFHPGIISCRTLLGRSALCC